MRTETERAEDKKLHKACRTHDIALAKEAIQAGADVNAYAPHQPGDFICYRMPDKSQPPSYPPLCLVAMHAKESISDDTACELTELLLSHGANIALRDTGDQFQNTCLHWAIATLKTRLTLLLIERDTKHEIINQISDLEYTHNTPLILTFKVSLQASYTLCNTSFMDRIPLALLKAGAETIHSDLYMQTALHWAAIVKAPYEVIFELLKRGAELFRENLFKCSPIDLYKQKIRFGPDPSELGGERTNTAFRSLDQPNASLAELCYHLDPIIIREDGNHLEQTCSALSLPSTYSTEDITKWCLSLLNVAHPIDARVTMLFDGLKKERSKRFTIFQSPLESELDTDARDPILNLSLKNTF